MEGTSVRAMMKLWMQRLWIAIALLCLAMALASAQDFPFDQEMLLDARPIPGTRRVPILEVRSDGKASLDMWCHSAMADVAVSGDEIKFTFTSATPGNCTPDRIERDQAMAKAFLEITRWRQEGDIVVLVGPEQPLRFRISTH